MKWLGAFVCAGALIWMGLGTLGGFEVIAGTYLLLVGIVMTGR